MLRWRIHSGTIVAAIHSGTVAITIHSGTIVGIIRSGTSVTAIHSGTTATITRSGTVATRTHSGTIVGIIRSGTVVMAIHSGTTATRTHSGTVANITIYWITFNTSLHLKVFDMCLLVAPTALYNMLKCLMARVVQALQTCFKLTSQRANLTRKLRVKIVAENSRFGYQLMSLLEYNICVCMHKYRTNTPIKM